MTSERKVFWSVPDVGADEKKAVNEVLDSGWLGMGPKTKLFEKELSAYTGAKHSIVVNNGTSALTTVLMSLGLAPGDEVLIPTYTFVATASSAIALGAKPVMMDCDPETFNVGPKEIEAAAAHYPKAKFLMVTDVAGLAVDIDAVRATAAKHNLTLIEDAAEAFGGKYQGQADRQLRPRDDLQLPHREAGDDGRGRGDPDQLRRPGGEDAPCPEPRRGEGEGTSTSSWGSTSGRPTSRARSASPSSTRPSTTSTSGRIAAMYERSSATGSLPEGPWRTSIGPRG